MRIFPAIDLRGGRVVRLSGGDYDQMTVYGEEPAEQARAFKNQGARYLHVVDLDGARDGGQDNLSSIAAIAREGGLFIEVGGGARDEQSVARYMDLGVNRVILGTLAVENRALTERLAACYPGRIAVGVDARDGRVAIRGWRQITDLDAWEFVSALPQIGVHCAIYTDISTDGMLSGTNIKAFESLSRLTDMDIVASGGISFEKEICALAVSDCTARSSARRSIQASFRLSGPFNWPGWKHDYQTHYSLLGCARWSRGKGRKL